MGCCNSSILVIKMIDFFSCCLNRKCFFISLIINIENILLLLFANESAESKTMFYHKVCLLNNLIKILLNNYTAVGCLMKCFQCGWNINSKSIKLLCALCIKQPQVLRTNLVPKKIWSIVMK